MVWERRITLPNLPIYQETASQGLGIDNTKWKIQRSTIDSTNSLASQKILIRSLMVWSMMTKWVEC